MPASVVPRLGELSRFHRRGVRLPYCADLVIVGVGERMTERLDPVLVKHLGSKGIRVEQMDTVSRTARFTTGSRTWKKSVQGPGLCTGPRKAPIA